MHGKGGRFQGLLVGLEDRLDDPYDKLNLVNKVKDKQVTPKVGVAVLGATIGKDVRVSWNQVLPKPSKATLWKDYTRPVKRSMVAPSAESKHPNMLVSFGVQPFPKQYDKAEKGPQRRLTAATAFFASQNDLRSSGTYGVLLSDAPSASSPIRRHKQEDVVGRFTGDAHCYDSNTAASTRPEHI